MVLRYRLSKRIRALATWVTGMIAARADEEELDFHREHIKKILLVRATFRMGDSILATPAIFLFRRNFPDARIDFVVRLSPRSFSKIYRSIITIKFTSMFRRHVGLTPSF